MLKHSRKLNRRTFNEVQSLLVKRGYQTSQSGLSGGQKAALGGFATVGLGLCSTIGYASYSPETRKQVEDLIPGSAFALNSILGSTKQEYAVRKYTESPSLLQKKLEREQTKKPEPVSEQPPEKKKAEIDEPSPKKEEPQDETSPVQTIEEPPKVEEPPKPTEKPAPSLEELMLEAQTLIENTVNSYEDLVSYINLYYQKVVNTLHTAEDEKSFYEDLQSVALKKEKTLKEFEEKFNKTQSFLDQLRTSVTQAKEDDSTKSSPTVELAEKFLLDWNATQDKFLKQLDVMMTNAAEASELQTMVEAGKKKLQEEIQYLVPGFNLESGEFREDQYKILIAHAYKRFLEIDHELAKLKTMTKQGDFASGDFDRRLFERRLQAELRRQEQQLTLDFRHRMTEMRQDFESDMRAQLKRQAAAHSDHLAEMLLTQEEQIDVAWKNRLSDLLEKEKDLYIQSLSKLDSHLKGLTDALTARAQVDEAAYHSHSLWVKCQTIKNAIKIGNPESLTWEDKLRPLKDDVEDLKKAVGKEDPFVNVVLSSLPEQALHRGVYTESALRERFIKVEKVCRRVAMVGDNGSSLVRYLISYCRSFFLTSDFEQLPASELKNEPLDVENMDVYDILARTRYCLEKDDLLQSVRYMKLLRGEAKHVAKDWIQEALLTLEAQQVADALMSYARAVGVKAL